ncbi:MAG TPA: hypothetical protein VGR57_21520 [Ktedonobacterales bacterium]|nr:hypothetical protein [Ktedonobacterales bacterium]
MERLRELAPLFVGLVLPPIIMLAQRADWSGARKFTVALLPALALGLATSALAGELAAGWPDGAIAVMVDTALVFTGAQLAYRYFWKATLEARLVRGVRVSEQRLRGR